MVKKLLKKSTYRTIKTKLVPFKKIQDEFYDVLYLANSGSSMFIPENLYCIDYAIRNLATNNPILEIGSFTGMSTNILIHFLQKYKRQNKLFTADKWMFEERDRAYYPRVLDKSIQEFSAFIRESFLRNLRFFNGERLPFTIELFSDEFFEKWRSKAATTDVFGRPVTLGGSFSFCYVDGGHEYEIVKRDFENIDQFIDTGGFIFFDDSASHIESGVREVMKEVIKRKDYELVIKNPNYLFRKKH